LKFLVKPTPSQTFVLHLGRLAFVLTGTVRNDVPSLRSSFSHGHVRNQPHSSFFAENEM
jgi:hypothetical protein